MYFIIYCPCIII